MLNRKDIEHPWLYARCVEVQENPDGYLDLWAREHFKSTIITYGLTIKDIFASHGADPIIQEELTFGIFSHSRPIAKGFLRQIKQEFERNHVLKEIYDDILYQEPQKNAPKWSEDEGISVKRKSNPKEQTIEAWGVVDGQPIGKHFKRLVYDDVVVPASVTTPDMMRKTVEMLQTSYNLGAEGGTKRFIGTPYHYNDAYRSLMGSKTAIPRVYPATEDGTPEGKPVLLTEERIKEKRREQGPYIFACQLLMNPKADENQGFNDAWLKYYDRMNLKGMNIYILFDPASEKKKTNDYTCGFAVGLRPDRKIQIINIVRDRLNLPERTRLVMDWHRKYKPIKKYGVRYEKYGKDADIEHIESVQESENYTFDITAVGGSTSKQDRIKRLIPYFEAGDILLPRSLNYTDYTKTTRDLVEDFINEEYKPFPLCVHDDMLDCLARLLDPEYPLIWPEEKKAADYSMENPLGNVGENGWMLA